MTIPANSVSANGFGSLTDDELNTYVQLCGTVAQARNFSGAIAPMTIILLGTAAPGDGGVGIFYWNATSLAPDDDGVTTIRPNGVATGAWLRDVPTGGPITGLALARNQKITWSLNTDGTGGTVATIVSAVTNAGDAMALQFQNSGLAVYGPQNNINLLIPPAAHSVNGVSIIAAVAGSAPQITTIGSDTNINLGLNAKGSGNIVPFAPILADPSVAVPFQVGLGQELAFLDAGGGIGAFLNSVSSVATNIPSIQFSNTAIGLRRAGLTILQAIGVTSAVNFTSVTNSITGNNPVLSVQGSDANVGLSLKAKGTGTFVFVGGDSSILAGVLSVPSAVNALFASPAATGSPPFLAAVGSDTNVGLQLVTQGTGNFSVLNAGGNPLFDAVAVAAAVNHVRVTASATGNPSVVTVFGTDANIGLNFQVKGLASMSFLGGAGNTMAAIGDIASSVNYVFTVPATTGTPPFIEAAGTDTNIGLGLYTKGTGQLQVNNTGPNTYPVQTTVGTGGGGSNIPTAPATYMKITVNGTAYVIPLFPPS